MVRSRSAVRCSMLTLEDDQHASHACPWYVESSIAPTLALVTVPLVVVVLPAGLPVHMMRPGTGPHIFGLSS